MDPGSKSLGGLLGEPITRHAYPRNVSDRRFRQLVDGDPRDHDPNHKPKDGDITGPIQAGESAWVILRREELAPANKNISMKDEHVRKTVYDMIYEVKLKEVMEKFFEDLIKEADIENRLTGAVKLANEEHDPRYRVDGDVKLMGSKDGGGAQGPSRPADRPSRVGPPVAAAGGAVARGRGPAVPAAQARRQSGPAVSASASSGAPAVSNRSTRTSGRADQGGTRGRPGSRPPFHPSLDNRSILPDIGG